MTSPTPPATAGDAYQDVITALDNLVAAIGVVLTDPDYVLSAADLVAELSSAIPSIADDIYEIALCGFDIFTEFA
jgi:hypothetical protein